MFAARFDDDRRTSTPMRPVPVLHLDRNGEHIIAPMNWGSRIAVAIRTREFSSDWLMNVENPSKKPPRLKKRHVPPQACR
ncbi:MAG: hypothetical protein ABIR04_14455 [Cypionkella sp.]